ncbi:MAG TPA: DUF4105 domain-containing protein [Clostridia bacterium]|nr:DUF4105 domain-containing protein [Clostridia bacterium]
MAIPKTSSAIFLMATLLLISLAAGRPVSLPADEAQFKSQPEPQEQLTKQPKEQPKEQPQAQKVLQLSPRAKLTMVTIFPGRALYSMFGHTAIRVEDPVYEIDLLYNYGQSSVPFDATFIPRFVTGELPFMLGVVQTRRAYDFYSRYENRSIYEQDLLLSAAERQAVFEFLDINARPENRIYIYDFFYDNCTTRVRDLLWDLFGDGIRFKLGERPAVSYRRAISPYLVDKPFVKFGINLMLGSPTDGVPGRERRLYLPGQFMEAVEAAELDGRPLMGKTRFIYEGRNGTDIVPLAGGKPGQSAVGPSFADRAWSLLPSLLLWLLFAAALILTFSRLRRSWGARVLDVLLFGAAGLVGAASLLLWIFSGYVMTTANYHLLWAWPVHVIIAFSLIKKRRPQRRSRGLSQVPQQPPFIRWYAGIAAAAALVALGLFPLLPQQLPAPAVPLLLSLALRGGSKFSDGAGWAGRWGLQK